MSFVELGDRIAIHYRVQGPEGELIAASAEGQPLSMTVGALDVIPGLSLGTVGMQLGENKALHLAAEDAFGPLGAAIERSIAKDQLPAEVGVGDRLRLRLGHRQLSLWIIAEQWGSAWRVTTQHPLAGKRLDMTIKVVAHQP